MTSVLALATSSSGASSGSWTMLIMYFTVAIAVSFFCSVWEAVLLSVTHPYVADLKMKRPRRGKLLEDLKDRIDRPLVSILTLNTVAHTVGAIGVGAQVAGLAGGGPWEAVAGALMTLAVLVLSEIIPKNLGARHWRAWAPWVAVALRGLTKVMTPVVWVVALFTRGSQHQETFSRDELAVMADLGHREGELHEDESRILKNLLRLRDYAARDVMTPRVVVFALQKDTSVEEFIAEHAETPFSRIPIFTENQDDIHAFVLKDEILLAAARDETGKKLSDLSREIASVPGTMSLASAFELLVERRHHISLVLDEFGGLEGLVTMEDVVETLLGLEIVDEADTRDDMQEFARRLWRKRAKRMGIDLEDVMPSRRFEKEASNEGKKP